MATDILILSNAPGEITTWVKPVVQALRDQQPDHEQVRISVMVTPCAHASGNEHKTVQSYPEVDRVQPADQFYAFLLTGKTADHWDWHPQGVVVFLGGDQAYPVLAGKRLGYGTVIYAEWEGRWQPWVDAYGAMQPGVLAKAQPQYRDKFTIVGDLMADVQADIADLAVIQTQLDLTSETELIGLLPGSKGHKTKVGMPLVLAIANYLHAHRPALRFVIPVAPTMDIQTLINYADPAQNPAVAVMDGPATTLVMTEEPSQRPYLKTAAGAKVYLWTDFPALDVLTRCQICLTTVGANTAQLGALAVPMIVMLPTQQLDVMRTWDGIPGILSRLPGLGTPVSKLINRIMLRYIRNHHKRFAWPNIWAQQDVVPELLDELTAKQVGDLVLDYLNHPDQLAKMKQTLRHLRGSSGAASKLANIILDTVR